MGKIKEFSVFSQPWRNIYGMQYVFGPQIKYKMNLHNESMWSGLGVSGKAGFRSFYFFCYPETCLAKPNASRVGRPSRVDRIA